MAAKTSNVKTAAKAAAAITSAITKATKGYKDNFDYSAAIANTTDSSKRQQLLSERQNKIDALGLGGKVASNDAVSTWNGDYRPYSVSSTKTGANRVSSLYDAAENARFKRFEAARSRIAKQLESNLASIESDYAAAMRMAVKHLAGLGHSEIVYLSGLSHEMRYDLRCDAYQKQMTELGLSPVLIDGDPPYQTDVRAGYRQASRLLSSQTPFTAVICGNDLMAIGAMRAFFERGLRVPEDISVVGFDGIDLGRFQTPSLTTLAVDARDFGEKAFELLYASMTQETTSFYSSKLKLIQGESTAQRR